MNTSLLRSTHQKCSHRDVAYKTIDDFFTAELVKEAYQHWQTTLGNLVQALPDCKQVLEETELLIEKLL